MPKAALSVLACMGALAALAAGCSAEEPAPAQVASDKKMIVLGVDGMDPELLKELLAAGELPNIRRLIDSGGFRALGTSNPPQSPVAWSNFITGMNPGGHGLFDFLALDRTNLRPYLSASTVLRSDTAPLQLGDWRLPLGTDRVVLLRKGKAFWELLEDAGVDVTILRMPANYPPVPTEGNSLSGMGTPDLRGTSGTFLFFSTRDSARPGEVSGGEIRRFGTGDGRLLASIDGPANELRVHGRPLTATLEVVQDPAKEAALIRVQGEETIIRVGEWSDWIRLEFELVPMLARVSGMVRLYLKGVHPETELYVSPVNIDPRDPAQVISSPEDYAARLAESVGPFYTEEMPEDTKALSAHVLSPSEFLEQSEIVLGETKRMLEFELARFQAKRGPAFLFSYFSSVDQRHHMMGRHIDSRHPAFSKDVPAQVRSSMRSTYAAIDEIVGNLSSRMVPDVAVVVMSDHGFSNFYRQAHLNAWLRKEGYLTLARNPTGAEEWLPDIDWARTRAFAIGLNSLYINVADREKFGIVPSSGRLELAREIAQRLQSWTDEETGLPVVTRAALREEIYRGPYLADAPDVIVGYGDGYRASWTTSKGQTANVLVEDNLDEWSADHCVDPSIAPGVLISNLRLSSPDPQLTDLTVGILEFFGVGREPVMRGKSPFQPAAGGPAARPPAQ